MAYTKLDNKFLEGPNDKLSDAAVRLLLSAILWCNENQTDGLVPADRLRRLVPRFRSRVADELLENCRFIALGDAGSPDAYLIHDYLDWNPSKEQIATWKYAKSQAGKKGAAAKWGDHDD